MRARAYVHEPQSEVRIILIVITENKQQVATAMVLDADEYNVSPRIMPTRFLILTNNLLRIKYKYLLLYEMCSCCPETV